MRRQFPPGRKEVRQGWETRDRVDKVCELRLRGVCVKQTARSVQKTTKAIRGYAARLRIRRVGAWAQRLSKYEIRRTPASVTLSLPLFTFFFRLFFWPYYILSLAVPAPLKCLAARNEFVMNLYPRTDAGWRSRQMNVISSMWMHLLPSKTCDKRPWLRFE